MASTTRPEILSSAVGAVAVHQLVERGFVDPAADEHHRHREPDQGEPGVHQESEVNALNQG
jgi:hypothetical protein